MSSKSAYQKYKESAVLSASKETLLLMLYEAAIKFTKKAIIACEQKNISDRGYNIGKAYDIILELNNTLDHRIGGEVARNLENLYYFMMDQLMKSNIKGDIEPLKSVSKCLETLYEGWKGAVEKIKNEKGNKGG